MLSSIYNSYFGICYNICSLSPFVFRCVHVCPEVLNLSKLPVYYCIKISYRKLQIMKFFLCCIFYSTKYISKTCISFLAHLAKGYVSFCHNLASVVCRPLTFHILIFSSETPRPYELKLVGNIYGRSSIKIAHFVPIHLQTWPPQAIIVSDWPIFLKIFSS